MAKVNAARCKPSIERLRDSRKASIDSFYSRLSASFRSPAGGSGSSPRSPETIPLTAVGNGVKNGNGSGNGENGSSPNANHGRHVYATIHETSLVEDKGSNGNSNSGSGNGEQQQQQQQQGDVSL